MGLVALVALGLLGMHGLTSASSTQESLGHAPEMVALGTDFETHATPDHAMRGANSGALDHAPGSGAYDPLHNLGQACLLLLAGGALVVFARRFGQMATERFASRRPRSPRARSIWSVFHHPPDPRLATVALRC